MGFGIAAGPKGADRHQTTCHVYDARNGQILAAFHFFGAAKKLDEELYRKLTTQVAENSTVPLEHMAVLSGVEVPPGEGSMSVDARTKQLLRTAPPARPIRA